MLACASMGAPVKGSWGSYQAWQAEGNRKQGSKYPTAAFAAVGAPKKALAPAWAPHVAKPKRGHASTALAGAPKRRIPWEKAMGVRPQGKGLSGVDWGP
jgi:hypothetical protein